MVMTEPQMRRVKAMVPNHYRAILSVNETKSTSSGWKDVTKKGGCGKCKARKNLEPRGSCLAVRLNGPVAPGKCVAAESEGVQLLCTSFTTRSSLRKWSDEQRVACYRGFSRKENGGFYAPRPESS